MTMTSESIIQILLTELVATKAQAEFSATLAREALSKAEEALIAVRAAKESTHTVSYVNPEEMSKIRAESAALSDDDLDRKLNGDLWGEDGDFEELEDGNQQLGSRPGTGGVNGGNSSGVERIRKERI